MRFILRFSIYVYKSLPPNSPSRVTRWYNCGLRWFQRHFFTRIIAVSQNVAVLWHLFWYRTRDNIFLFIIHLNHYDFLSKTQAHCRWFALYFVSKTQRIDLTLNGIICLRLFSVQCENEQKFNHIILHEK